MTYVPEFDLDREYGESGERTVRHLLGLDECRVEVKRKRYLDDQFYVETCQSPKATGDFKASGINTTRAAYWAYAIGDTGVVVFVPTDRLRDAARDARQVEEQDGDNPTKGRLVSLRNIVQADGPPR